MAYRDRWIECTKDELRIRGYYFPWGTKRIPYEQIRAVQQVSLAALRGLFRIWGTSSPRYWASLDPKRPGKTAALVLDIGGFVRPFITPDDVEAVAKEIEEHSTITVTSGRSGWLV